jgi:hypothetical protein
MKDSGHPTFDQWLILNSAASRAEAQLRRARLDSIDGRSPAPSARQVQAAADLRATASQLLTPALQEMRRIVRTGAWPYSAL